MKLHESVAVVTGASRRLGSMIAAELALRGAKVVVHCHTDIDGADRTVFAIRKAGGDAIRVACDLTDAAGVEKLSGETVGHFGRWDALVNCASIFRTVAIERIDADQWEKDQAIHQRAPFFLSRQLYLHARELRRDFPPACVVNITDAGSVHPVPSRPSYYCAKSALDAQTKVMAVSLAPFVRVNAVAPGAVIPADGQRDARYFKNLAQRLPLQTCAAPEAVVDAVVFLLGNDSITGQSVFIDGGEHLL